MRYRSILWRVSICAFVSDLVMGGLMFAFGYVSGLMSRQEGIRPILSPLDSGYLSMMYSWMLGSPGVVFLIFIYSFLVYRQKATILVVVIGCSIPGVLVLINDKQFGLITTMCGLFIGTFMHVSYKKIFSNKSFKPTALRAAA